MQSVSEQPLNDLGREALSTELNRVGVYLGVAWALGLTALALVKLVRVGTSRLRGRR